VALLHGIRYKSIRRYTIDAKTGCWNWYASTTEHPYAKFTIFKKTYLAHRYFYEFYFGKIPNGQQIDHVCNNKICVNPYHLRSVSPRENVLRTPYSVSGKNIRKTHCDSGHPLSGINLYITPDDRRQCKICRKEAAARSRR
jgi:hypothetical protein